MVTAPQVVYLSWSKPQKKIAQSICPQAEFRRKGGCSGLSSSGPSRTCGAALDDPHEERSEHKNVAQDWSVAAPQLRDTCQHSLPCWGETPYHCSAVWHSAHMLRSSLPKGRDCQRSLKTQADASVPSTAAVLPETALPDGMFTSSHIL